MQIRRRSPTLNFEHGTWNFPFLNPEPHWYSSRNTGLNPRRLRRRSGVVLLIVVSLLTLFILLGITYTIAVNQYVNASKLELQVQRVGDSPDVEADSVLGQILYDTQARTVLQYHSLLRDLYGYDANIVSNTATTVTGANPQYRESFQGTVTATTGGTAPYVNDDYAGYQFKTFQFQLPLPNPIPATPPLTALSPIPNYYAGRVITFQSGAATNHSTRIVAYTSNLSAPNVTASPAVAANGQLTIEAIESKLAGSVTRLIKPGDLFTVNGAPFNGTGSGYSPATYNIDNAYAAPDPTVAGPPYTQLSPYSVALLPNISAYDTVKGTMSYAYDYGGLDETWDAPDLQNMFLAMIPPRAAESFYAGTGATIIPSFHRPELVNYWFKQLQTNGDIRDLSAATTVALMTQAQKDFLRTIVFRPMPWDHPNFTGSNPYFTNANVLPLINALRGQDASGNLTPLTWDVDNDGDSIPDSIWIDPGLPVVTTPEGRRYKRLAAILVKDLDGSINLNAHGNLAQVNATSGANYRAETAFTASMISGYTPPTGYALGTAQVGQYAPRGLGFGPAEVSFLNLFNTPTGFDTVAYGNVLLGRYASNLSGDYGASAAPGQPGVRDLLSSVKHNGLPNDYANMSALAAATWYNQPSWYASPPDVWGRGAVVLDFGGQPFYAFMGQAGEAADSPYEICLSGENNNADTPYTVAELERLLRYHDNDATQLPPRLLLAGTNGTNQYFSNESPGVIGQSHHRRHMVTTLSSDINVPATPIPPDFRLPLATLPTLLGIPSLPVKTPGASSILDLYYARLVSGGVSGTQLANEMQKIIPWEFFKGQKFDINRVFGDGLDTNGDGTRDDPYEAAAGEAPWQGGNTTVLPNLPATFQSTASAPLYAQYTNGVNVVSGGPPFYTYRTDNLYTRQLYARHLFCLAMLLLPPDLVSGTQSSFPPGGNTNDATIGANQTTHRIVIIRRIAQWAVNCVDYRDHDSVMTPFEFDYNPWNGWQVDGNPATNGSAANGEMISINGAAAVATPTAERGLVWGMESPDVVISETLAFHDRGLKDTTQPAAPPNLDQFRVPKGSLFVELYCPRPTQWLTAGQSANTKPLNTGSVNLAQLAPADNSGYQRPVWRLAFSRLTKNDPNNPATLVYNPATSTFGSPETTSAEQITYDSTTPKWTANMSLVPGVSAPLTIDRFAYFANAYGTTNGGVNVLPDADMSKSFWWNNAVTPFSLQLQAGQYAVVAPRLLTYLGSQNPQTATTAPPAGSGAGSLSWWGGNSNQYIQVLTNSVVVTNTTPAVTSRTVGTDMRSPLGIVCDVPYPLYTAGDSDSWKAGLNISEPMPATATTGTLTLSSLYYPTSTIVMPSDTTKKATKLSAGPAARATNADFYGDPDTQARFTSPLAIEVSSSTSTQYPIVREVMTTPGTYTDCSCVLLQRLANPNLAFNPPQFDSNGNVDSNYNAATKDAFGNIIVNPYITVDWQTIDLTVFNGEEDMKNSAYTEVYYNTSVLPLLFRSRQRGFLKGSTVINGTTMTGNPWPPLTRNDSTWVTGITSKFGGSSTYFDAKLSNNLTNSATATTFTFDTTNNIHSLGSLNSTVDFPIAAATNAIYYGEPAVSFPWIAWNNRPYTNAMELLSVPAASPGRFFLEMTPGFPPPLTPPSPPPALGLSPYADASTNVGALHLPFGQMLNFFQTASTATPGNAPHFYRLLDYVEVPSPYAGTERWYNPQNFGGLISMTGQFTSGSAPASSINSIYRPPFNKLSRFRDPGRVNVNTIFDNDIWDAVVGQFPGLRTADNFTPQLLLSRQGDGGTVSVMNQNYPTRFANPIRPADSADLMPNVATGTNAMRKTLPVAATLLRADPTLTTTPLFQINSNNNQYNNWVGSSNAAPNAAYIGQYHDITRNPYFANQTYQKIGSLLTTRSNCFAVWITIGYFEVEDYRTTAGVTIIDAAHPDGLALAQEVGADSGEITRHRAFYIIDRSIPVGFLPGSRLNTDDCVLVRRLIE